MAVEFVAIFGADTHSPVEIHADTAHELAAAIVAWRAAATLAERGIRRIDDREAVDDLIAGLDGTMPDDDTED